MTNQIEWRCNGVVYASKFAQTSRLSFGIFPDGIYIIHPLSQREVVLMSNEKANAHEASEYGPNVRRHYQSEKVTWGYPKVSLIVIEDRKQT